MFCVSVLISSAEWQRFEQTAQVISQGEKLSRSEIIRRHALAGIKPLREASLADQARMTHEFQSSMAAPDERLWAGNSLLHRRGGETCFPGGGHPCSAWNQILGWVSQGR